MKALAGSHLAAFVFLQQVVTLKICHLSLTSLKSLGVDES